MSSTRIAIVGGSALLVLAFASRAAWEPRPAQAGLTLRLAEIQEVRRAVIEESEGFGSFAMATEEGITIEFRFDDAPSARRVVLVEQPEEITATDSTGEDLTGIEPSFMDENVREYLEPVESMDDEGDVAITGVTLHLTTSRREATTIDVAATFQVATSAGTEAMDVEITDQWKPLEINGEKLEVRAGKEMMFGGQGIEVRPASAQTLFDSCAVIIDGEVVEPMGTLESMGTISYSIDEEFTTPATARFMVFTDYRREPVRLELKGQPLP